MNIILLGIICIIIGVFSLRYVKRKKDSEIGSVVWCVGGILLGIIVLIVGILRFFFVKSM